MAGLFVGAFVSGIVPLVNAELLVIGAAAILPPSAMPAIAVVSTLGQMVSKTLLFTVARWAPAWLPAKVQWRLSRASHAISARGGAASWLVVTSAAIGFPPFYGVSLACGALRMGIWTFVLCGGVGRLARFGLLAWVATRFGPEGIEIMSAWFVPDAVQ